MALRKGRPPGIARETGRESHRSRGSRDRIVEPRYVIGIDLGTTNCSLAYADSAAVADALQLPPVALMPVPQLVNAGEVRDESLLPSSLYCPGTMDLPEGSLAPPWDAQASYVVGRLAQKRGVENAGRLISSAKSWLAAKG